MSIENPDLTEGQDFQMPGNLNSAEKPDKSQETTGILHRLRDKFLGNEANPYSPDDPQHEIYEQLNEAMRNQNRQPIGQTLRRLMGKGSANEPGTNEWFDAVVNRQPHEKMTSPLTAASKETEKTLGD